MANYPNAKELKKRAQKQSKVSEPKAKGYGGNRDQKEPTSIASHKSSEKGSGSFGGKAQKTKYRRKCNAKCK